MNNLVTLQNIPISNSVIGNLFPDISGKNQKVRELERAGEIIRLKRGLYVVSPEISGKPLSSELVANRLYGPSYVSMQTALRYYGLIPEAVYVTQSLTVKHSRCFENAVGRFQYLSCHPDYFSIGLAQISEDGCNFVMASPEKALCDLVVNTPGLNLRYKKELLEWLEEDIRLDMDAFSRMNPEIIRQCAAIGKKKNTLNLLVERLLRTTGGKN
ncbi:MAG: hypothetical protein J6X35_05570 [Bacteroidales bacterium]|nr:hypothetical protein [Bacteroidales bacterium]